MNAEKDVDGSRFADVAQLHLLGRGTVAPAPIRSAWQAHLDNAFESLRREEGSDDDD